MTDISRTYDTLVRRGAALARPASREEMARPLATVDRVGWLGPDIRGQRVLCLAAGGGRQGPLYAAAGADVTVVDISPGMLSLDREMARQYRLDLRLIEAPMDSLPMLDDASFDLVIHPVSTCYVKDVQPVFAEVARLLRGGGLYVSQHKQPVSLQSSFEPTAEGYVVRHTYYRSEPVPPPAERTPAAGRLREAGATEYLHRWEELIGGICRAGFVIEDLVEPLHRREGAQRGSFAHRADYVAPYVRIRARRVGAAPTPFLALPLVEDEEHLPGQSNEERRGAGILLPEFAAPRRNVCIERSAGASADLENRSDRE